MSYGVPFILWIKLLMISPGTEHRLLQNAYPPCIDGGCRSITRCCAYIAEVGEASMQAMAREGLLCITFRGGIPASRDCQGFAGWLPGKPRYVTWYGRLNW